MYVKNNILRPVDGCLSLSDRRCRWTRTRFGYRSTANRGGCVGKQTGATVSCLVTERIAVDNVRNASRLRGYYLKNTLFQKKKKKKKTHRSGFDWRWVSATSTARSDVGGATKDAGCTVRVALAGDDGRNTTI